MRWMFQHGETRKVGKGKRESSSKDCNAMINMTLLDGWRAPSLSPPIERTLGRGSHEYVYSVSQETLIRECKAWRLEQRRGGGGKQIETRVKSPSTRLIAASSALPLTSTCSITSRLTTPLCSR